MIPAMTRVIFASVVRTGPPTECRAAEFRPPALLHEFVRRDLRGAQPQEPRGVVIENVPLLRGAQERRLVNGLHGSGDQPWPDHLVRSEHHAIAISRIDNSL